MTLWFILVGLTFAVFCIVAALILTRLAREAARDGLFQSGAGLATLMSRMGAVLTQPDWAELRRALLSSLLALFLIILTRPYFTG